MPPPPATRTPATRTPPAARTAPAGPECAAPRRTRSPLARVTLAIALAATARVQAELPPPLPHFGGASITLVLDDARLHGVPTRIRQFEAAAPAASVRAFYLQAFDHAPVESAIDGWQVLAWKQGMHLLTARLRPCRSTGGACTEGTLSESDLSAAGDHPRAPEVPPGSVLATDLEMNDAGRQTRMLAWHEEASPTWAAARLVRQLSSRGLTLERRMPASRTGLRGESLWFGGRGREAIATILAGTEGTTVTLQTTIHPGHGR